MRRPTPNEVKILKALKFRVKTEAEFALQFYKSRKKKGRRRRHRIRIGSMSCIFYPLDQKLIDQTIKRFTTNVW